MARIMADHLELRPLQIKTLDAIRDAFRAGHRSVICYGPPGFGKTELAISLMAATADKGNKAAMVLDRIVLCDQTSKRLEKYRIDHGVLQSGHWRYRPDRKIQVCSAQTIEKRGAFPGLNLLIVDECFPGDVEILTERGFIRFDALEDELVAQFSMDTRSITFVKPTATIKKPYDGDMVRLASQQLIDLMMTPGHELVIRDTNHLGPAYRKIAAVNAAVNIFKRLPVAATAIGVMEAPTAFERLLIAAQADGSIHTKQSNGTVTVSFTFSKARKIERFLKLVAQAGLPWAEVAGHPGRNPRVKAMRRFMVRAMPANAKRIAEHFSLASMGSLRAAEIIEEMVHWDGHIVRAGLYYFSSVDAEAANFYQAVALLAGYKTNLTLQIDSRKETFSDVHRLFINKDEFEISGKAIRKSIVQFIGNVHCVRVPDGNIVVRSHGKPLIVGNCHTQREQTIEFIKTHPHIRVIGLSASPFTKGLGSVYSSVISGTTTKQLVDEGWLSPLRVFIAKQIDMTGAKKIAGEWSAKESTERGVKITGDVVAEWVKMTHELFGGPRKTIVFCAGVSHGQDLADKFAAAGYNFVSISYKDDDEFKKSAFEEFSKPDTSIHGLIATDLLTKGYDQADVMIGVSARPFTKSFASHVQQIGRVMRSHPGKEFSVWLDHSGNFLRFRDQWDALYSDGVSELDDGAEKTKPEPTDKEKEAAKCPQCGALWPRNSDTCIHCGHMRPRRNDVIEQPGELTELSGQKKEKYDSETKKRWFSELLGYARLHGKKDGWAWYKYQERFGVEPPWKKEAITPSYEVEQWIRSRNIAYAKRKK